MPFKPDVRLIAVARTGGICANPRCSCYLLGPGDGGPYQVDVFEAAHIISEAVNGPRYRYIPNFDYDHISNCIPLCRACHRLVDHPQNWQMYGEAVLQEWKNDAEEMARMRRNKPINVPFFDPNVERQIKQKFVDHLAKILDPLWGIQHLVDQGVLPQSVYTKIWNGSFGFTTGKWGHNHPSRSHDARIAYRQDALIETMNRLIALFRQRHWASYTWLQSIELCTYRVAPNSDLEQHYLSSLKQELHTLSRQAHDFIEMP